MKFWKLEYTGPEQVTDCIENCCLPPIHKQHGRLECTDEHPRRSMRVGDGVLLATLIGEPGKIFAAGIVSARPTESDRPDPPTTVLIAV